MISPFLVFQMDYSGSAELSNKTSRWDILPLVSGPKRRWYAAMHAAEQNRMCQ
jgi:hypothetical protein